jgi:creatinine amidohydrolase/Fe(II)-dependent formamide hydrolase-like protein
MNTEQIRTLNRDKTVVLLPGGILEEHGPYLPPFTDGYWNERLTHDLAKAITARPGWSVVIFPTSPPGNSGANDIGGKYSFPARTPCGSRHCGRSSWIWRMMFAAR